MFFSIRKLNDVRFPNHFEFRNGLSLHYDNGWEQASIDDYDVFFKGYIEGGQSVRDIVYASRPHSHGNFVCIIANDKTVTVTHDRNRSFPLYSEPDIETLTNLPYGDVEDWNKVFADRYLVIRAGAGYKSGNYQVEEHTFRPFDGPFSLIKRNDALDQIEDLLRHKAQELGKLLNDPIKVYFTGGVDTGLLLALLRAENIEHELLDYEHVEYDEFTCKNLQYIRKHFWAYKQIHHWREPTWLASGAPGDEYFMRGPTTLAIWSHAHGINLIDEIAWRKNKHNLYHARYFLKPENRKILQRDFSHHSGIENHPRITIPEQANLQVLDMNVNDHQHWHLGNTLTWTPYRDTRFTEILLSMSPKDVMEQALDASITRELIRRLDSDVEQYVSPSKNFDNMTKICELFK